ncbi:hypothetical protein CAAU_2175 [Caloramator australicus RC3]|uniref:Uncharacterized protein n=1 Tax=Caloramator australicus RC3 TaxID=857293 RepID=I7KVY2_9CLOT|nr:hypothetical protein CAAU_2175 [Caloramator australicus RC3]
MKIKKQIILLTININTRGLFNPLIFMKTKENYKWLEKILNL